MTWPIPSLRLSRRDRAAIVLAYEHLREWSVLDGKQVPRGGGAPNALSAAIGAMSSFSEPLYLGLRSVVFHAWPEPSEMRAVRLLRARLALLLRCLLRAADGDYGEWRCVACGSRTVHIGGPWCPGNHAHGERGYTRYIRSLWSPREETGETGR